MREELILAGFDNYKFKSISNDQKLLLSALVHLYLIDDVEQIKQEVTFDFFGAQIPVELKSSFISFQQIKDYGLDHFSNDKIIKVFKSIQQYRHSVETKEGSLASITNIFGSTGINESLLVLSYDLNSIFLDDLGYKK